MALDNPQGFAKMQEGKRPYIAAKFLAVPSI